MELDKYQQEAVNASCDLARRVVAVTGEAGTGKTSIMRLGCEELRNKGYSVALCAPTGKAAKRIFEATGIQATTIHRLLEYTHPGERDEKTGKTIRESYPRRHAQTPLEFDVVFCDEYAMVNHEVHRNLFDALPRGGCVRVFGDMNQLPPIEKNDVIAQQDSPFLELLKKFEGIVLKENHRQGEGSGIVLNGHRINQGFMPTKTDDFRISFTEQPVQVLTNFINHFREQAINYDTTRNQIITPGRKSWVGTLQLNASLQQVFRPESDGWLDIPRHKWDTHKVRIHKGDKVLQDVNNYELEIFNGESGIVTEITDFGEIEIDLGDRVVIIPPSMTVINKWGNSVEVDPRRDLQLAYAITTHKSQGSEYDNVIYILNKSTMYVQNRRNFYTAITRARKSALVITDQRSISTSVNKRM